MELDTKLAGVFLPITAGELLSLTPPAQLQEIARAPGRARSTAWGYHPRAMPPACGFFRDASGKSRAALLVC